MAVTEQQVIELYIATFDRAPDKAGLDYWVNSGLTIEEIAQSFFDQPETQSLYPDSTTDSDFVTSIYENVFGREPDAAGLDYWVNELSNGMDRSVLILAMVNGAQGDDAQLLENKTAVAEEFVAKGLNDVELAKEVLEQVTADPASVDAAIAAFSGSTESLTIGADQVEGGSGNDTFVANLSVNQMGVVVNTLQTGDQVDGGAGVDTLDVTMISDATMGNLDIMAVRPILNDVEKLEVTAVSTDDTWGSDQSDVQNKIRLNLDDSDNSLQEIWSDHSEASLVVENVTNIGDTEDLLIGMRSTGNHGSLDNRNASNFEVYFEEDELTAGQSGEGAYYYDLVNQKSYDANSAEPLKDFPLSSIRFDIKTDGGPTEQVRISFTPEELQDVTTHAQLVAKLNEKLSAMAADDQALKSLEFVVEGTFTDGDSRTDIPRIQLVNNDPVHTEIVGGAIALQEEASSGNIYWDQGPLDTVITDEPVTATVVLDDVGRGSDGGYLRVGSMSEDDTDSQHGSTGIEVYDIKVGEDSSVSGLYTTNDTLKEIYISSLEGKNGDLELGNTNTAGVSGETIVQAGLDLIKASSFDGNLKLAAGDANQKIVNLKELDAQINGDVTFNGSITEDSDNNYKYTTGDGDDVINIAANDTSLDTIGTGLAINAANGENTITVDIDGNNTSFTENLKNLSVTTGSGADNITIEGAHRFDISSGAGTDIIYINAEGGTGEATVTDLTNGAANFQDRVLYKATLTVTYAGFSSTVTVPTSSTGNYVADQVTINKAIISAIENSSKLSPLVGYELSNGDQKLKLTSLQDGVDNLEIKLNQPTVTSTDLSSSDVLALQKGILATTTTHDSEDTDTASEVATIINNELAGNIDNTGAVGNDFVADAQLTGTSNGAITNTSVINAGPGSYDTIILSSADNSANTIKFDNGFDSLDVKNFFTDGAAGGTLGEHLLDFTSVLTALTDPSDNNNTLSASRIATHHETDNTQISANEVVFTDFNTVSALDGNANNTFSTLTESEVLKALQADGTFAVNDLSTNANLVGTTAHTVILVENNDNAGQYKMYDVTIAHVDDNDADAFKAVKLMGTVDFGNSINDIDDAHLV